MEEQARFSEVVANRPVGFICHGHSLEEFLDYKDKLIQHDLCWGSLNNYKIAEKALGKPLDFVVAYTRDYKHINPGCLVLKEATADRGYNTLHEFLIKCIEWKIKEVILFGADGYSLIPDIAYWGGGIVPDQVIENHREDTYYVNQFFPRDTLDTTILNCSTESQYTAFRKISYEELLMHLDNR